jgi:hypothetical protein
LLSDFEKSYLGQTGPLEPQGGEGAAFGRLARGELEKWSA